MDTVADLTCGLDNVAWGIMSLLSRREPTFARWNPQAQRFDVTLCTRISYRLGQGKCCLRMWGGLSRTGPSKIIIVGEAPATTDIRVESWELTQQEEIDYDDPPVEVEIEEFPPGDLVLATEFIVAELRRAYEQLGLASRILAGEGL